MRPPSYRPYRNDGFQEDYSSLAHSPITTTYDGANMLIQFQTESNVTYRLQASTNLTEGAGWEDVTGESLVGDGGGGILESQTALPVRFLRLRAD